jgi:hypothetical protein
VSIRPIDREIKVVLTIFGYKVLYLPGLFTNTNNYMGREVWLEREILLLNSLKRKLKPWGLIRPITREETTFLNILDKDDVNPIEGGHKEWLMDAVMTVNSVRKFK